LSDKSLRITGGFELALHCSPGVVIETKKGGDKAFFQNCAACKQRHGSALRSIWRGGQNLTITLEKGAGYLPGYVLGEGDDAVVQGDVKVGPVE